MEGDCALGKFTEAGRVGVVVVAKTARDHQ